MSYLIDTHVHFWQIARGDYGWLSPARPVLFRDYLPADYLAAAQSPPPQKCILVQAAPTEAETAFLLDLARQHSWITGVSGWVDFLAADVVVRVERVSSDPSCVGLRPMAGVAAGAEWLNQSKYDIVLGAMAEAGLVLDALAQPHQLPGIAGVAARHSELKIVINHAAKPTPESFGRWHNDIAEFAKHGSVACKVSGFTQQSNDRDHHLRVFDRLLQVFGPDRLMLGSDYPVLLETSDLRSWANICRTLLAPLTPSERRQIEKFTAAKIYGLTCGENEN